MKFINRHSKPSVKNPLDDWREASPIRKGEKSMNQTTTKSSVASNVLLGMIVAAAMIFSSNRAEAEQLPPGCSANNLTYNINNLYGLVNVTNGTVVTFVTTVMQPIVGSPQDTTCNIIISNLVFFCSDTNGNPTVAQLPALISGPNTVLPPGYNKLFTNQCAINVNPGVLHAVVKVADAGALVQDNPQQDDGAAIIKTLSVNVFNPCIQVTKQCNGGPFGYGQPISFVVTVTNCGDVQLGSVTVVDDEAGTNTTLISGLILQPGQGTTFTTNYIPSGNPCGPFTNNVTATGLARLSIPATVSSTASAVCTVITAPCISVTKTCPSNIVYGTTSYPVSGVVNNCGNVPLVVTVVDAGNFTNSLGTIQPGGSAPYSATITVPVGCGPFTDTVTATGNDGCNGSDVTSSASCTTTVTTAPCIRVTKNCPASIAYGTTSYTVSGVVTNCGNVPLSGVTLVDAGPGGSITISVGTLAVGGIATYSTNNTVPVGCGPFTDTVTASGTDECNGSNITSSAQCTTTVTTAPCISVTKTCPTNILYGTTSYPVSGVVTNCGNVPLSGVTLVDAGPGGSITISVGPLAIGGIATYSTNNTVPVGCGPFTDTVTASGTDACNGSNVTSSAQCTTTVTTAPCVQVSKVCGPTNVIIGVNGIAQYTVSGSVINCGNVPLTNVVVVDHIVAANGVTHTVSIPIPGTLAVNGTAVIPAQTITTTLCGPSVDHFTVTADGLCGGAAPPASSETCTTIVECRSCLGDFVWDDLNHNGIQDAGEPGISNLVVNLLACGSTNVIMTTITSTNGYYLFCDLVAGSYQVQVVTNNYLITLQNAGTNDCVDSDAAPATGITDCVTLPAGVTNVCTDIGLFQPATLGDFVWNDLNQNGIQETGEPGIPNVVVNLLDCASNLLASTTTDSNGLYHFVNLMPGNYMVEFVLPSGYVFTMVNVGNDASDSDAGAAGLTGCYTLISGETNLTVDAGLILLQPQICVTKGIICAPANGVNGCDSSLTYGPSATGLAGTNQSAFCYQIIVWNCGPVALNNVRVTDNLLGAVAGFPPTLAIGQSATNYYGQSYGLTNGAPSTNVNTVIAIGTGQISGITTRAQDSATAIVLPIGVSCGIMLNSPLDTDGNPIDNHVTLPAGSVNAPVQVTLTINNTGLGDLNVNVSGLPPLVDCVTGIPMVVPATTNIPAGQSITIDGCVLVSCPGTQMNVTVQGTAVANTNIPCIYDSFGNVIQTAMSSCPAAVECTNGCVCVDPLFGLGLAGGSAVLQLGPNKVSITGPAGGIVGNISIAPNGKLSMSGDEYVTGTIRLGVGAQFQNSSHFPVTVQHNVDLSAEINAAYTAYSNALVLPCTQSYAKLDGQNVTNITGVVGMNVICVGDVSISGKQVYLTGPAGAKFIIRVTGKFSLTGGGAGPQIRVAGGVQPSDVLYVLVGTGAQVAFSGGGGGVHCCKAIVDGTLLAPYRKIALSPGLVNGELISGQDISIVSGSSVRCPCQ
jgi:SdrD B-like domain